MASQCSSLESQVAARFAGSINSTPLSGHVESVEIEKKKCISDVRRTFCLFVTFDLLFISLLWIIELNVGLGAVAHFYAAFVHTSESAYSGVTKIGSVVHTQSIMSSLFVLFRSTVEYKTV